jgi:hypothetical protein
MLQARGPAGRNNRTSAGGTDIVAGRLGGSIGRKVDGFYHINDDCRVTTGFGCLVPGCFVPGDRSGLADPPSNSRRPSSIC